MHFISRYAFLVALWLWVAGTACTHVDAPTDSRRLELGSGSGSSSPSYDIHFQCSGDCVYDSPAGILIRGVESEGTFRMSGNVSSGTFFYQMQEACAERCECSAFDGSHPLAIDRGIVDDCDHT